MHDSGWYEHKHDLVEDRRAATWIASVFYSGLRKGPGSRAAAITPQPGDPSLQSSRTLITKDFLCGLGQRTGGKCLRVGHKALPLL